ncbi:MAG: leucine-rich repeat protein [Muribaculaceae bacterium]|nr:leucine-rich repeat protein [Muribaculaceae bacterium]
MKKKITLLLLLALFAMTASAYTYINNVEIGNFKYSYLALGSSSSEENYAFMSGLSSTASTSLTTLDIPGYVVYNGNHFRVKQINQNAFHNNTKITSVTFGYGVEYISSYVFDGCTNLKYVNLPSSVKEIGQFVFQNCTSLYVVAFAGEKAPKIYDYTFNLSSSTKKASTATYRGMNALKADAKWVAAFGADNILRHYSYKVGDFKVYNSTNGCWQYYTIKNGVPYNGNSSNPSVRSMCMLVAATFTDGSNYTISLPQRVGNSDNNAPGSYLFYGVADSAFMNNTAITQVTNNNTMAYKIGNAAFRNCTSLQSVDVPVDTIDMFAFYNCSNLASVNFASSLCNVVYLGSYAFGKCKLSDVTIPKTTKYIGYAPFYNNSPLGYIAVDADNPNYCGYDGCLYNKSKTVLYQVPGIYSTDNYPETLQRILQYAAAGSDMPVLYAPYNVKTIEQYAFQNCKSLKVVHLPSSITTVNVNAFAGCDAVNRVELNLITPPPADIFPAVTDKSSVELYTPYEGYDAYAASSIWKHYNRKTGDHDHTNCWDIKSSLLEFTVTSTSPYNHNGFTGDGTLKVVRIPSGTFPFPETCAHGGKSYVPTEIGYDAVVNLAENLTITEAPTITKIGEKAFYCTRLRNFPFINVEEIGPFAFGDTYKLIKSLTNLNKLKVIGDNAFRNSSILKFEASTTLTYIGESAFKGCDALYEIFLPHIDGKHPLTCGDNFFADNAQDFKCWVDYRQLGDFVNSTKWDGSKIYPHLCFDYANNSQWQSFACVKNIDFEGTGLEAYRIDVYDQATQRFILKPIIHLFENEGALVHGNGNNYYRLNYATNNLSGCSWLQAVTDEPHTVVSNSTTSYYDFGGTDIPRFDLIRTNKTITRGHAYVKMNYSVSGGVGTIYTDLDGSGGIPGDVNGDGNVTAADVTALYDFLLNNDTTNLINGDQNGDGNITAADVTAVYTVLLGQ